jgi:hypothetical protein
VEEQRVEAGVSEYASVCRCGQKLFASNNEAGAVVRARATQATFQTLPAIADVDTAGGAEASREWPRQHATG